MAFQYDPKSNRYRQGNGRYLSESTVVGMRDAFVAAEHRHAVHLAANLNGGDLSVVKWEDAMRSRVGTAHTTLYLLGRGGIKQMTPLDYATMAGQLHVQYAHLRRFAQDLLNLSPAQRTARAALYFNSATAAYERGRQAAHPGLVLPAHPGDGSTACRSNCRCHWVIKRVEGGYRATWVPGAAEHCDDCIGNATRWAPLELSAAA